jgi:hypothetical protein
MPDSLFQFPRKQRVYCTQWANCGWKGVRVIHALGVQPGRCPRCGKEVTA